MAPGEGRPAQVVSKMKRGANSSSSSTSTSLQKKFQISLPWKVECYEKMVNSFIHSVYQKPTPDQMRAIFTWACDWARVNCLEWKASKEEKALVYKLLEQKVHQLEPDDVVFILWTDRYGKQIGKRKLRLDQTFAEQAEETHGALELLRSIRRDINCPSRRGAASSGAPVPPPQPVAPHPTQPPCQPWPAGMSPSAWSESIVERIEEAEKKLLKVARSLEAHAASASEVVSVEPAGSSSSLNSGGSGASQPKRARTVKKEDPSHHQQAAAKPPVLLPPSSASSVPQPPAPSHPQQQQQDASSSMAVDGGAAPVKKKKKKKKKKQKPSQDQGEPEEGGVVPMDVAGGGGSGGELHDETRAGSSSSTGGSSSSSSSRMAMLLSAAGSAPASPAAATKGSTA